MIKISQATELHSSIFQVFSRCNCAPLTAALSSGCDDLLVLCSYWQEVVEVFVTALALQQVGEELLLGQLFEESMSESSSRTDVV